MTVNIFDLIDLSFTIKKWGKPRRADIGSDLLISCKTNDPNANVTLNWTKRKTNWTNIETLPEFDGRIIKRGQIFRVKTLKTTDSGDFVCEAGNEQGKKAELFLGKVLVMEKKKYMQRHEEF